MPDGSLFGGPYAVPPPSDDERIRAPIDKGLPEKIPGLSWNKPDFLGLEHKIVCSFAISRKKRPELDCVPCAICSGNHPKFLEGAVLWSSDGWLRVIGHVCAAKPEHFGVARYRKLQKAREQEQLDSVALNWLQANIAHFAPFRSDFEKLKQRAIFIESQQKIFFQNLPELAGILENIARRNGGMLTVAQELSGSRLVAAEFGRSFGAQVQTQFEHINIGVLDGLPFLIRPRRKRSRQFEGFNEALSKIPEGDGEQPILDLIDQGGENQITITAGIVFRAVQRALKLAEECAEAERFFRPENLAILESWGADSRNTMSFNLRRLNSQVTFVLPDRSRATILTDWPKLPNLESLKGIVAAGLELDGLLPRAAPQEA
jgi:hypothetical protein